MNDGKCVGGPWAGRSYRSASFLVPVYAPEPGRSGPVQRRLLGEYRWAKNLAQWQWEPL